MPAPIQTSAQLVDNNNATGTKTFAMPGNFTSGNSATVECANFNSSGLDISAITISGTAAVKDATLRDSNASSYAVSIWRAQNIAGGNANIVVTYGNASASYFVGKVKEWAPFQASAQIGVSVTGEINSGGALSLTTGAGVLTGDLVLGVVTSSKVFTGAASIAGPTAGYTQGALQTAPGDIGCASGHKLAAAGGAQSAGWTIDNAGSSFDLAGAVVVYRFAAATAPRNRGYYGYLASFALSAVVGAIVGATWGHFAATARDTTIGSGMDALGRPTLTMHASARAIFVRNGGSDAADGLTNATAKATLNAGQLAMRNGVGDWVLVAAGQTFDGGLGNIGLRSGLSAIYPSVITTYDLTDPLNAAKYRLGRFYWGANLGAGSSLDSSSAQAMQWFYAENGYSVVPEPSLALGTTIPPQVSIFGGSEGGPDSAWMFYNWSFAGLGFTVQGDFQRGIYPQYEFTCNTTTGSAVLTNLVLTGGSAPSAGSHVNGSGPLTGIPFDCTVLAYNAGAATLTLNQNCTDTRVGIVATSDVPRYHFKKLILRRVCLGRTGDIGIYAGATEGLVIEDSIVDRGGYVGKQRNRLPDMAMSANAGAGAGTGTFTLTSAASTVVTCTGTTVNGSATLGNVTLLTGDLDYFAWSSVTGPGVPASTSIPSFRKQYVANVRKHNMYFATHSPDSIVRRTISSRASLTGLQQRGGGISSDNSFVRNPVGFQPGGGDYYWLSKPYGVNCTGGHNVICGSDDVDVATPISVAMRSAGNVKTTMSQVKNLICNYGGVAGGLYNLLPVSADQYKTPSAFNLTDCIIYNWPRSQNLTLAQTEADPGHNFGDNVLSLVLINNICDGDGSWNTFAGSSGNLANFAGSFPNPNRTEETFAVSLGYASFDAYMDFAVVNLEIDHALNFNTYMRAGFGH